MVLWTTSDFQVMLFKICNRGVNYMFLGVKYPYLDLYKDHHIWVPIYLDHHFWAGMRSTQRSESMHSFFNKFITQSREQAERELDATNFHTVILRATKSSIEAQEVQTQFRGKANCIIRLTNSALGYSIYEVGEQVSSSIFNKFVVTYDSVAAEVKCQCLLFESRGILCCHALSVLSFEQVSQVSSRYILERICIRIGGADCHSAPCIR
ncbi:hypothetical protein Ahy_A05g023169 isoform B [Arachis hypogaea]|uniref:Protein FAR1-RELATED SEQUENCE n=1 Tax=Arachis hypogaea TaxID=3818 RepID=A0A445D2K7_ARAHY|nr:hypothetical protein Ahy_A05g023169 isoform B [Arachis hypogaea]